LETGIYRPFWTYFSSAASTAYAVYVFSVLPASRWQGLGREADRRVVAAFLCDRLPFPRQDAGGTLNAYYAVGS